MNINHHTRHPRWRPFRSLCLSACLVAFSVQAGPASQGPVGAAVLSQRFIRNGVVVDFRVRRPGGSLGAGLMEGQVAELRFRLTEQATGVPIQGNTPGVWMDMGQVLQGRPQAEQRSCKDKIALYLGGAVGIRPMLDLNSYYVVVMNREPTLSIVDPLVSMVGVTSTLAMIRLKASGADWAKSADERRLFVSMPAAGQVAVVDTEAFKRVTDVQAGLAPTRVALQPDGRFLWVGNDTSDDASGVTVIDTETLAPLAHISTGAGHHEIAFSDDSRWAFVSSRESGTVSVIDVQDLARVKEIGTGPMPISLAWSTLASTVYVADGEAGTVTVLGGEAFGVQRRIVLAPGLGPLRFTQDGRFALVVNPAQDRVYVLDPATDTRVHAIQVSGKPYQLAFSRAFAYVRPLANEYVTLINLLSLGQGKSPITQRIQVGSGAPRLAGDLPLADSIATTSTEAAGFVVNPADNTTYFYMEGMNAPSSNYKVYGASARAVTVVDRSLKEIEPGVYASKVKIPAAGRYDVAFLLETPRMLHCFSVEAKANPSIQHEVARLGVEYLSEARSVPAGDPVAFRFRLVNPQTGQPRTGLKDVGVLFFRLPGKDRTEVYAKEEGEGIYRAMLPFPRPGAYYVYVGVRSERVGYSDLPYYSVVATEKAKGPAGGRPAVEERG